MSLVSDESFEDQLRRFAREFAESVERAAERFDLDGLADQIAAGGEQLRQFAEFTGHWMSDVLEPDAAGDAGDETSGRRRVGGPHPLDDPTEEQGLALSALVSARWRVKPGTNELESVGDGPDPGDSLGLAGELRARDWIAADGSVTELGRAALRRWSTRAESDDG
jgi:hypothetical protein